MQSRIETGDSFVGALHPVGDGAGGAFPAAGPVIQNLGVPDGVPSWVERHRDFLSIEACQQNVARALRDVLLPRQQQVADLSQVVRALAVQLAKECGTALPQVAGAPLHHSPQSLRFRGDPGSSGLTNAGSAEEGPVELCPAAIRIPSSRLSHGRASGWIGAG